MHLYAEQQSLGVEREADERVGYQGWRKVEHGVSTIRLKMTLHATNTWFDLAGSTLIPSRPTASHRHSALDTSVTSSATDLVVSNKLDYSTTNDQIDINKDFLFPPLALTLYSFYSTSYFLRSRCPRISLTPLKPSRAWATRSSR
jgi:hypothetical protein